VTRRASEAKSFDEFDALEALVGGLRIRLYEAGEGHVVVDDLLETFEGQVGTAVETVRRQAEALDQAYARARERAVSYEWAARTIEFSLSKILLEGFRAFTDFDRKADLEAARSRLAEVEDNQRQTFVDLEEAVSRGDVDAVLRLRTESEVLIPNMVAKARAEVLDLEVAKADVSTSAPQARLEVARARQQAALSEYELAVVALEKASIRRDTATWWLQTSENITAEVEGEGIRLRARRDAETAEAQRTSQSRLRNLAGLPEAVSA